MLVPQRKQLSGHQYKKQVCENTVREWRKMLFDMLDLSECHTALTSSVYGKLVVRSISALPGTWTTKWSCSTQALLEVCVEKQDHPGSISSHLLFLLFHIDRAAESFEIPYESKKVNAWIPCSSPAGCMMLQGGTSWCRISLPAPAAAMLNCHSWISRAQKLALWGGSSLGNLWW